VTGGNGSGAGFLMAGDAGPGASTAGLGGQRPPGPPVMAPAPAGEGWTIHDYLAVLRRRWWVILLVVVVATAGAYYLSNRQAKRYTAAATIIYKQQLSLVSLNSAYTDVVGLDREMSSINSLLAGPELRERVATLLKNKEIDASPGFSVSAEQQSGGGTAGSNIVVFTGDSTSPQLAASSANASAGAFVEWNKDIQRQLIDQAIPVIKSQLKKYNSKQDKLTTDYLMLQSRLQDLEILKASTTGNYRMLAPASVPDAPYAPDPKRSALVGFAVGLFAGIGLAFLLEQFDTRIRRPDQIAEILRQPILGRVPRISKKLLGESALVALRHPDGHVAEAFRMVRTNLDFMAVDADVKSIVVTSCMKGEGKSVTLANLAISMAMAGKKVIVVDADLRRPRMHKFFGLDNESGMSTVATGRDSLFDAVKPVEVQLAAGESAGSIDFEHWAQGTDARSRLYVLTSGPIPPNPGEIVASRRFASILEELATEADLVLVDTPAMLAVGDTSAIASRVDGLVFLVDMRMIKGPQLSTAADQLMRLPVRMLGTVVRMQQKRGGRYYYYSPYYYYGYSYTDDGTRVRDKRRKGSGRRATDQAEV
jgi:non-specific protein-tyrosine kinase